MAGADSYQLKETLWCGIVISSFIGQIYFAHFVHASVNISHELTDRYTYFRLSIYYRNTQLVDSYSYQFNVR